MVEFILNDQLISTDQPPGGTMLDFIRYHKHLTGTKIGCREGDCGACTVLVGTLHGAEVRYQSMTSCLMPLINAHGKHIVTVEGINPEQGLTPVQKAMVDESGTQCGFCTVGFVMSLTGAGLLEKTPDYDGVISAIDGNICRCTGYKSIERAAARLAAILAERKDATFLHFAIEKGLVPAYFASIRERLAGIMARPQKITTETEAITGIVGGGTDLYVQKAEEMLHKTVQNLYDQTKLQQIALVGDQVEIGAAATVTALMESEVMQSIYPNLRDQLKFVSSTPIRNMATVAGNLVNASPIGDLSIWFLAMQAKVVLNHLGKLREIPLSEFYLGYKSLAKSPDEMVEKIVFKKPTGAYFFHFEKVCKRTYLDIASVNSAILMHTDQGRIYQASISVGGVSPIPLYLKKTSAFLTDKMLPTTEATLDDFIVHADAIMQSEIAPISDVRGTTAYKRLLSKQLLRAHFQPFVHTPKQS